MGRRRRFRVAMPAARRRARRRAADTGRPAHAGPGVDGSLADRWRAAGREPGTGRRPTGAPVRKAGRPALLT